MGEPLAYVEILSLFTDEELEDEYGWHRTRGKEHRRRARYGLYWWHQKHAGLICDEIGRRSGCTINAAAQLALDIPGRIAPELRLN